MFSNVKELLSLEEFLRIKHFGCYQGIISLFYYCQEFSGDSSLRSASPDIINFLPVHTDLSPELYSP